MSEEKKVGINHKDVRFVVNPKGDVPPDVERENKVADWAEGVYRQSMLIAAAGVLKGTGSLDLAASVLWWAGYQVPRGYDLNGYLWDPGDLDPLEDEEALRMWVEKEAGSIADAAKTVGARLAMRGMLLDDATAYVTDRGQ